MKQFLFNGKGNYSDLLILAQTIIVAISSIVKHLKPKHKPRNEASA